MRLAVWCEAPACRAATSHSCIGALPLVRPLAQLQNQFLKPGGGQSPNQGHSPKAKCSRLRRGKPAPHTRRQAVAKTHQIPTSRTNSFIPDKSDETHSSPKSRTNSFIPDKSDELIHSRQVGRNSFIPEESDELVGWDWLDLCKLQILFYVFFTAHSHKRRRDSGC
jgi:hypothetical protein